MLPWLAAGISSGSTSARAPEHHIHHPGAGFHIAGRHRGGTPGIEQGTLRRLQPDRAKGAGAGRGLGRHQATEYIEHRCGGHRQGAVDIARHLRSGAGEVHRHFALAAPSIQHLDGDIPVALAVVVHQIGKAVFAVRNPLQGRAAPAFRRNR